MRLEISTRHVASDLYGMSSTSGVVLDLLIRLIALDSSSYAAFCIGSVVFIKGVMLDVLFQMFGHNTSTILKGELSSEFCWRPCGDERRPH